MVFFVSTLNFGSREGDLCSPFLYLIFALKMRFWRTHFVSVLFSVQKFVACDSNIRIQDCVTRKFSLSLFCLFLEVKEMVKIFFKMCIRLRESIPLLSISEMKKTNRCDIKQGFLTFATWILHSQSNYKTANFSHMRLERNRHHIYDGFVAATADFRYDDEEKDYERKHISHPLESLFFSNLISKTGKIKATEIRFWKPPSVPLLLFSRGMLKQVFRMNFPLG